MTFTRAQIAALIIGSMMFLPGLCFLAFGLGGGVSGDGGTLTLIGMAILGGVGILGFFVFRRERSQP